MRDVVGRNLGLLHGEMQDLMRPGAITGGVNVRRVRLHEVVGENPAVFRFDPGVFQIERCRIRNSPERKQDFFRGNSSRFPFMFE